MLTHYQMQGRRSAHGDSCNALSYKTLSFQRECAETRNCICSTLWWYPPQQSISFPIHVSGNLHTIITRYLSQQCLHHTGDFCNRAGPMLLHAENIQTLKLSCSDLWRGQLPILTYGNNENNRCIVRPSNRTPSPVMSLALIMPQQDDC